MEALVACVCGLWLRAGMPKRRKPNRRTRAEWSSIIDAWQASGVGAEEFARDQDFAASSLYTWRKRLGVSMANKEKNSELSFVPVVVEDGTNTSEPFRWRLETRDGMALSMSGSGAMDGLALVIRALGERGAL